ncbi:MAG: MATE family efflux transporter [Defluviimonas sp.]|uniref:MATE family efflux transporter n=1 Tax=Albidovulum sp. TaxID=1872424 RepID=UPI001D2C7799|nr:MATE family efflux transporter [Paracoccaceae bacterium]MCC0064503.1 MATE family efflux transporter [Defluviimonas sp.]
MSERQAYRAHAGALVALGLPLVGSNLAQMAVHVTDTVMVGWYGVEELAAVVLGATTFFTLFLLGAGFAQAVMPLVATAIARGDETQVRRDTRMGLWLSLLYGAAIYPALFWSAPILVALGQRPELAALAENYLRIAGLGMVPALLVMSLKSFLSALERAGMVLWATVFGGVLNALCNWALIFGNWGMPELGVKGAAIASVASQSLTLLVMMVYATRHPALRHFLLFQRFWRPDWVAFAQIWRLGWPIGLTGLFETGLFSAAALMMGWIGTLELAAHGIALELAAISFMCHLGLSNAATVRAGRAYGARDMVGLGDGALVAMLLSGILAAMIIVLFLTVPAPLIALFLDQANPDAPAIIAIGTVLLATAALFQLADAAQVMALGFLRGVQDTRVPMYIASVSYWLIGMPVSYLFAFTFGLGAAGLWLGLVVGLTCASVFLMLRFWRGPWFSDRHADRRARTPV